MVVMPPKRLHDALGLLNDMFKKLDSIIFTTSSFGNKLNLDLPEAGKPIDMNGFIKYSNNMIDETEAKTAEFRKYLGGKNKHE